MRPDESVATDNHSAYREHALRRLQLTAMEMGATAVLGSAVALLARLLIPTPEYVWLRVALLPLTALFAYIIVRAPSVCAYGIAHGDHRHCRLQQLPGALGTDRPLLYFVPAATIIVLSTSLITLGQWIGGSLACYVFFPPFVIDHTASRTETVFSLLFAVMGLVTGFVTIFESRTTSAALDQESRLAKLSITDAAHRRLQSGRVPPAGRGGGGQRPRVRRAAYTALPRHRPFQAPQRQPRPCGGRRGAARHVRRAAARLARGRCVRPAGRRGVLRAASRAGRGRGPGAGESPASLAVGGAAARWAVDRFGGVAGLRNGESVLQTLHADLAMLRAKQSGRDTVCIADEPTGH